MFSRYHKSHQTFWLLFRDNLSPKTFKNRPIYSIVRDISHYWCRHFVANNEPIPPIKFFSKKSLNGGLRFEICFFLKKWAIPSFFFVYFCVFKQAIQFLQQIYAKNVHPVYGARIQIHGLQDKCLLPLPLDQGSRQRIENCLHIKTYWHYFDFTSWVRLGCSFLSYVHVHV